MAYEIIISKSVEKEIAELPITVFNRIDKAILSLEQEPRPKGCLKLKSHTNLYRIRVGTFRIIYQVDDILKKVDLRQVDHKKRVYKRK